MTAHRGPTALLAVLAFLFVPSLAAADEPAVIEDDRQRIQEHLTEVEQVLSDRDVSDLSSELRAERQRNLERLRDYRKAGEFPHNTHVDERRPVFIDRQGRACAVGHLMIESGWRDAAKSIQERENLAYLPDMDSPEVAKWVAQSGLTAEEAALIQPTYSPCEQCGCHKNLVCGADGHTYLNSCVADECENAIPIGDGCCAKDDEVIEGWLCEGRLQNDDNYDPVCEDGIFEPDSDAGHSGSDAGHSDAGWDISEDDESDSTTSPDPQKSSCAAISPSSPLGGGLTLALALALGWIGVRRTSVLHPVVS